MVLPRADSTATTRLPSSAACTIRPAARLMRSASATDVPPNFITTVWAAAGLRPAWPQQVSVQRVRDLLATQRVAWSTIALAVLLIVACASALVAGALAARRRRSDGGGDAGARGRQPDATAQRRDLVPRPSDPAAARARGGSAGQGVPRSVAELADRLPLERKVAQLFLVGFEGQDLTGPIFRQLRRLDLGGMVIGPRQLHRPPAARARWPARPA